MPISPSASPPTKVPAPTTPSVTAAESRRPVSPRPEPTLVFRRRLITRLVAGSVIGALLIGGILFFFTRLRGQAGSLSQKRSQLTAYSLQSDSFDQLTQSLALVAGEADLLKNALLVESEIKDLLDGIAALRERHGLSVGNLAFSADQPKPDQDGNHFVELVFEANGSLSGLVSFLHDFSSQPRFMRIVLVDISLAGDDSHRLILKTRFYTEPEFTRVK